jgi:predicted acylesterase/phospholipase RssA
MPISILFFPSVAFPTHKTTGDYDVAPWIGISLSGGGLRAAAFAHGVMLELRKFCLISRADRHDNQPNGDSPTRSFSLHYLEDIDFSDDDRPSPCGKGGGASFLDNAHFLSGVSGGAITAAYYKTHPDRLTQFGRSLKDARIEWKLFTGEKHTPIWRPPLMLIASLLDTIFQTFKLPLLPIPEVEVAPFTTMVLYNGLFESEQLVPVYNDLFLHGHTFGELERQRNSSKTLAESLFGKHEITRLGIGRSNLLINATDIANGRILTFDKETFACLGDVDSFRKLDLATAVAASSTLPGVFSPMQLKSHLSSDETRRIPTTCALILGDRRRWPVLVDGGVSDNLGVTGLLRAIFSRKNRDSYEDDGLEFMRGHSLDIGNLEISKELLTNTEPSEHKTTQEHNPRSQKTFLLIVNSGVSADSSLPGLAGHLDNSFDVLIRDRTDLSRVVAHNLLGNFGFGVVELNMRDLVKNSRVVTRIVSQSLAIGKKTNSTSNSIREISRAFDFTEMERKVLSDLNRVSLLPSPEEIDTLILAGRAVVAELSSTIKAEFEELADKQYSPSCDKIVNPKRLYCWPQQLETPHLVANKVGVMLELLTQTSEDFSKKVAQNRANQLLQITSQLRELYSRETRALDLVDTFGKRQQSGFDLLPCRLMQDSLLRAALRGKKITAFPVCDKREGELLDQGKDTPPAWSTNLSFDNEEALREYVSAWLDPYKSAEELKNIKRKVYRSPDELTKSGKKHQSLDDWAESILKKLLDANEESEAKSSPWYDYILGRFSMFQDRSEKGFRYIYRGTTEFPDDFNLSYILGLYSIQLNQDFYGGLKNLHAAIEKTRAWAKRIEWLPDSIIEKKDKEIARRRFERAEEKYSLLHAKYTALSPIPLSGRPEFVSDEEIDSWLNEFFPDGHGGNDFSLLLKFTQEAHPAMLKNPYCKIKRGLDKLYLPMESAEALQAFTTQYEDIGIECTPGIETADTFSLLQNETFSNGAPCGDTHFETFQKKFEREVCKSFSRVRYAVRALLAPKNALIYARGQARRLYEAAVGKDQVSSPYLWERADLYGLVILIDAIHKDCPHRTQDIQSALRLFHIARASIDIENDYRLKIDEKAVAAVKARIARLIDITRELTCGRD